MLTAADFYGYRLHMCQGDFNVVLKSCRLTQQSAVDQWAKIEGSRLDWVCQNQKSIRAEKYQGLLDAFRQDMLDLVQRSSCHLQYMGRQDSAQKLSKMRWLLFSSWENQTFLSHSRATQSGLRSVMLFILERSRTMT